MLIDHRLHQEKRIMKSVDGLVHWIPTQVSARRRDGSLELRDLSPGAVARMRFAAERELIANYSEIVYGIPKHPGQPAKCMFK